MCGITGWISYQRDLAAHRETIWKMTQTLAARGPDAGAVWVQGPAALGHRRLAVMDPAGGSQPMCAQEQGETVATLVYNGEIYNFAELRAKLKGLGHDFKTRCDTEVVLRGYLEWGAGLPERLNGMFAFAVWDLRAQELLLVRDRLGVKPLFWYPTEDGVLFGSEPKAIFAHPSVQARVDADGMREVGRMVKNPERTFYSGMSEVCPGQLVRVSRERITKRRYWSLSARAHEHDLPTTIEHVGSLLDDIVKRQMISDVPLCTLLSGGLDSSIVTALVHQAMLNGTGAKVRSFSVDFARQDEHFVANEIQLAADTPFVRDFVAHSGCDHTEITLDSAELGARDLNRRVMLASDGPLWLPADTLSSLYRLFQMIRAESTVALSGESADEVFGGYGWLHHPLAIQAPTFTWLAAAGDVFCPTDVLAPELLHQLDLESFEADSYAEAIAAAPVCAGDDKREARMRELCFLHLTRFLPVLLDRKDRMSMALGLEVRVPYCDHRLVEYVFNIPWRMKTFDGREKSILRAAGRHLLPDSILQRRKVPYPSTQDPAYETEVRAQVTDILGDSSHPARHLFNRDVVEEMLARPLGSTSAVNARAGLERVRALGSWVEQCNVTLAL